MLNNVPQRNLLLCILTYFVLWLLVPKATFLPVLADSLSVIAATRNYEGLGLQLLAGFIIALPTVLFMAIQIATIYYFSTLKMNLWQSVLILVLCLFGVAALVGLISLDLGIIAKLGRYPNLREQLFILGNYYGMLRIPISILTMLLAATIGYMVSLRVTDRNLLVPVVMLAAYIDFWTVTRGPVATVIEKAPDVVSAVSTPIPQAGAGAFMPITMIGPGDFLFLGLVFAVAHKFAMRPERNYWFIFGALTLGMLAVMFGLLDQLPALIVLMIGVLAANWGQIKLTKQEAISVGIVAVLLIASLPLVWGFLKPEDKPERPSGEVTTKQSSPEVNEPAN